MYGVAFYHFMEFTSSTPPPNLLPYFAAEGPYAVSVQMVLLKVAYSAPPADRPKLA